MAVNKVIYNNQTLIDLTADTATAADVSSGKTFHLADGTIATGTGSGGASTPHLTVGTIRPSSYGLTLVEIVTYDKLIHADENVTIPQFTTSSTTLKAAANAVTLSVDTVNYDYLMVYEGLVYPTYNAGTTPAKGYFEYSTSIGYQELVISPANTIYSIYNQSKKITTRQTIPSTIDTYNRFVYWSSASNLACTTGSYGAYLTFGGISTSGTPATSITIKRPALMIRGSTSYFTSTFMNAISDIRYQYRIRVFKITKGASNVDGGSINSMYNRDALYAMSPSVPSHTLTSATW